MTLKDRLQDCEGVSDIKEEEIEDGRRVLSFKTDGVSFEQMNEMLEETNMIALVYGLDRDACNERFLEIHDQGRQIMKRVKPMLSEEESPSSYKQGEEMSTEAVEVARLAKEARLEERRLIEEGLDRRQKVANKHEICITNIRMQK